MKKITNGKIFALASEILQGDLSTVLLQHTC